MNQIDIIPAIDAEKLKLLYLFVETSLLVKEQERKAKEIKERILELEKQIDPLTEYTPFYT